MSQLDLVISAVIVGWLGLLTCVEGTIKVGGQGNPTKMSFKTPELNEEEAHSLYLPERLKCDACIAVTYQLYTKFKDFNEHNKQYNYKLPESEILDLTESICGTIDTFSGYGIKAIDGENRLTGAGLETSDKPGVIAGGGKWPGRLVRVCQNLMEEAGEDEIYAAYRKNPKSLKSFEDLMCRGKGIFGECNKTESQTKQDRKKTREL